MFGSNSSGGLFGGNSTSNSGSLFGAKPATTNSGGLFGGNSGTSSSGGLFGSSNNSNNNTSLFGNNSNTSNTNLFGSTNNTNNSNNLFGSSNTNQQSSSLFGNNATTANVNSAQPPQIATSMLPWWMRELVFLKASYAESQSQSTTFTTFLYDTIPDAVIQLQVSNMMNEDIVSQFKQKRKEAYLQLYPWLDEREWRKTEEKVMDFDLLPLPIFGIKQLKDRVLFQAEKAKTQLSLLQDESESGQGTNTTSTLWVQKVRSVARHKLSNNLASCDTENKRLQSRIVALTSRLEQYLLLTSSASLNQRNPGETRMHSTARTLVSKIRRLERAIAELKQDVEYSPLLMNSKTDLNGESKTEGDFAEDEHFAGELQAVGSEGEEEVLRTLDEQSKGLEKLMEVVRKNVKHLHLAKKQLNMI